MASAGQELQCAAAGSVHVVALGPNGERLAHRLHEGENLLVGRDRTCSLRLEGDGVASLHCSLSLRDGRVSLQDWYSESGTLINGERVESHAPVPPGAEIEVGGFRLAVEGGPGADLPASGRTPVSSQSDRNDMNDMAGAPAPPASAASADGPPQPEAPAVGGQESRDDAEIARLQEELQEARAEADRLREDLRRARSAATRPDAAPADPGYEFDAFQQDSIATLQAEIETLQGELAERDAQLAELSDWADGHQPQGDPTADDTAAETAALADRLEQLLDELERSDGRISQLEDLLRLAEDAKRAEQEERRQLESWVGDIEHRVAQWESEWQAEIETLQQRIEQLTSERDRAEQRLQQVAAGDRPESSADGEMLETLRQRNGDLQRRLEESERRRADLEQRITELEQTAAPGTGDRESDLSREEQVELAQERAALARERAELTQMRDELQEQAEKVRSSSDARFRAFREHLREIHEQEKQERAERSLSSRLGRLWKRLEGRPT